MWREHRRLLAAAACAATIGGCAQGPYPVTTGGLTGSWAVENAATHRTAQISLPTGTILTQGRGAYVVSFFATSPNGVTRVSWSGSGNFKCYAANGQYLGPEPSAWPPAATPFSPPRPAGSLLNPNFVLPCGAGSARIGSTQTITATASDATGAQITGVLTMQVNPAAGI